MLFEPKSNKVIVAGIVILSLSGCSLSGKNEVPPPAPAPVVSKAPTYVIEDVHFDFDRASLKPSATETLDSIASDLRAQPEIPYEVGGHTDSVGSVQYNQDLSERRAITVQDYLVGRGVSQSQLASRGYSESKPIASNDTIGGRAMNRRVEIKPLQ